MSALIQSHIALSLFTDWCGIVDFIFRIMGNAVSHLDSHC